MKLLAVFVAVLAVGCVSATPTPLLDQKGLLGNVGDTLSTTLLPAPDNIISTVTNLLSTVTDDLLPNIISELQDAILKAFPEIAKLLSALGPLLDAVCVLLVKVGEALKCLLATVQEIANVSGDCTALLKNLDGCLQALVCSLVELVAEVVRTVNENADKLVETITALLTVLVCVHDAATIALGPNSPILDTLPMCLKAVVGNLRVILSGFLEQAKACLNQFLNGKIVISKVGAQLQSVLLQLQTALRGICGK